MSLDIIAYDPVETENRKDKFEEKYNVPFENDMFIPSKDDFFYYLHPQWLERDANLLRSCWICGVLVMKKYKKWRDRHENKTRNWY
ncbi:hypothetical protein [Lactobacillus johnsonii]